MDKSDSGSLDRRGFIKGATAGVLAASTPGTLQAQVQDYTDVPSDPALRVKVLESLLVDKGSGGSGRARCPG